jgi:hypothetical protein
MERSNPSVFSGEVAAGSPQFADEFAYEKAMKQGLEKRFADLTATANAPIR